jgi:hypothetical protein
LQVIRAFAYFLILMAVTPIASAYIGPGSGISIVGSLFGLLATILLAVGAILFWPYRRMLKKRMQKKAEAGEDEQLPAGETLRTAEVEDGETK